MLSQVDHTSQIMSILAFSLVLMRFRSGSAHATNQECRQLPLIFIAFPIVLRFCAEMSTSHELTTFVIFIDFHCISNSFDGFEAGKHTSLIKNICH